MGTLDGLIRALGYRLALVDAETLELIEVPDNPEPPK